MLTNNPSPAPAPHHFHRVVFEEDIPQMAQLPLPLGWDDDDPMLKRYASHNDTTAEDKSVKNAFTAFVSIDPLQAFAEVKPNDGNPFVSVLITHATPLPLILPLHSKHLLKTNRRMTSQKLLLTKELQRSIFPKNLHRFHLFLR